METMERRERHLAGEPEARLRRPLTVVQPFIARPGRPTIDLDALAEAVRGIAVLREPVKVESPAHWEEAVRGLGPEVDAVLPVSVPAYPTEVWNSHPACLAERGLPVVFWPLMAYDEPDFWRWSARDMLRSLGVDARLVRDVREGKALLRSLAVRRLLRGSAMVVFGEQNFPWNAHAASGGIERHLGMKTVVRSLADLRARAARVGDAEIDALWAARRGRYVEDGVRPEELRTALRVAAAVRSILREEAALGFGVNCYGDLIPSGGRDVPCLAQALLREEGYLATCDGDFCALASMALVTLLLDAPCMMSNMYPVSYVGALRDHFGDPLSPDSVRHPRDSWRALARLAHCGYVGVVPAEMSPTGRAALPDWGGTYEIKRDGRGCGIDADLAGGERMTVVELKFDGKTLLLAGGSVLETTRHHGLDHCRSSALLSFDDLPGFVEEISREHTVVVYGDRREDLRVLAGVLGLDCRVW